MIVLPVVVLLAVVLVLVLRSRGAGPADGDVRDERSPGRPRLAADLDRWVAAGLLERDQATAILDHEAPVAPRPATVAPSATGPRSRVPVVAEALGYLGGALALGGLVLVLADRWSDLATASRLALALAGVVLFGVAGALTPAGTDPALARLRAFLWLLASAATAVAAVVVTDDLDLGPEAVVAWSAGAVAVVSGLLWWWRDRPVQQAVTLAAVAVAVVNGGLALVGEAAGGLALWTLGGVYLGLGLTRATPRPGLTDLAASVTLVAGPAFVIGANRSVGLLLLSATTIALVTLVDAVDAPPLTTAERVALAVPAGLGLVQGLPPTLVYFAVDAGLVTGLAVAAGGALVLSAVRAGWARWPVPTEVVGALALVAGPALAAVQFPVAGPVAGVVVAAGLVVLGTRDDRLALSMVGAAGLLAHVPWALAELFPGEARLPLLLGVVGALLVAVAVLLTRQAGRLHHHGGPAASAGAG